MCGGEYLQVVRGKIKLGKSDNKMQTQRGCIASASSTPEDSNHHSRLERTTDAGQRFQQMNGDAADPRQQHWHRALFHLLDVDFMPTFLGNEGVASLVAFDRFVLWLRFFATQKITDPRASVWPSFRLVRVFPPPSQY